MEVKEKEIVRTTIDLPAALNEKLIAAALNAKRSRHAQMLVALEKFFEAMPLRSKNGGSGAKEKAK